MAAPKKRSKPAVGTIFEKRYEGKRHELKVVRQDGDILFELDQKRYTSPSAAAKSLTKSEVNGWRFWKID